MKILMVGDVVGSPGRQVFAQVVGRLRAEGAVDFVVVNAENAAGGRGLTATLASELLSAGADVITMGDHTWDQRDLKPMLDREPRIVRPANFAPGCPGSGVCTVSGAGGERVSVINLVGRVFMKPYDCPFRAADDILRAGGLAPIVLVDFHAEATSEKTVLGNYLDGRVSAVVGSHTHVQTSDERLLPKGSAYITDLGMTGPRDSSIGMRLDPVTQSMITGMPTKFEVAEGGVHLEGVILDVTVKTGHVRKIKRVREALM